MTIGIGSRFDAGNIDIVDASDHSALRLRIRPDNKARYFQWFYFRVSGVRGLPCRFVIENASEAAYTKGWEGYRVCASYDLESWFRVPTEYDGRQLVFSHRPNFDAIHFAYFPPYSMARHRGLIARCLRSPRARLEVPGRTVDGDDLDLLVIRDPRGKRKRAACWFLARQHPGETMAEWWMEGFLDRLLDAGDATAAALLDKAVFYLVPNMNPDGSRRGHLRTNAAGANLNREWAEPAMERSPEVFLVRQRMHETGVDFCLDVHGDEALPYNFLAGMMGIPSLSDRQKELQAAFDQALLAASPDFQTEHGYPASQPGKANLTMCANYVAETFGCLSLTLEMPFKDNADKPEPEFGWSPARARAFGAAHVDAIAAIVDDLR